MHDSSYKTAILAALSTGPRSFSDVRRDVVFLGGHTASDDFRRDFFDLVGAGRVRRAGTTPDGVSYLFVVN